MLVLTPYSHLAGWLAGWLAGQLASWLLHGEEEESESRRSTQLPPPSAPPLIAHACSHTLFPPCWLAGWLAGWLASWLLHGEEEESESRRSTQLPPPSAPPLIAHACSHTLFPPCWLAGWLAGQLASWLLHGEEEESESRRWEVNSTTPALRPATHCTCLFSHPIPTLLAGWLAGWLAGQLASWLLHGEEEESESRRGHANFLRIVPMLVYVPPGRYGLAAVVSYHITTTALSRFPRRLAPPTRLPSLPPVATSTACTSHLFTHHAPLPPTHAPMIVLLHSLTPLASSPLLVHFTSQLNYPRPPPRHSLHMLVLTPYSHLAGWLAGWLAGQLASWLLHGEEEESESRRGHANFLRIVPMLVYVPPGRYGLAAVVSYHITTTALSRFPRRLAPPTRLPSLPPVATSTACTSHLFTHHAPLPPTHAPMIVLLHSLTPLASSPLLVHFSSMHMFA
ncbi:hypothetical transcript [Echinococcus multilocularis]|uniref:Hypothetical transcript n=1 Tax=Echinococcus multilocularis TaxID=6211 RepID=A0A087VWY0_ECHMU|nr:hypothetical transcript [Echinococcus multilocularis]